MLSGRHLDFETIDGAESVSTITKIFANYAIKSRN